MNIIEITQLGYLDFYYIKVTYSASGLIKDK